MLTDSVESFKKEKEALQQKLSKVEQEQKKFNKEKESLMNKNKDKIEDIQKLNKQNDRLTKEIKRLKEEKSLYDSKIVTLENDNEHYQNKIREFEVLAEDLENQLESALEENITLQTEFETFKQMTGDQLIRKDEEIRDIKNDLINRDKFIQRMQKRENNTILVKNIQKNIKEGSNMELRRRFTILPGSRGAGKNIDTLAMFQKNLASKGILGNPDDKSDKKTKDNDVLTSIRAKARNSLYLSGFVASITITFRLLYLW
jgi:chromosome segregation ATPase